MTYVAVAVACSRSAGHYGSKESQPGLAIVMCLNPGSVPVAQSLSRLFIEAVCVYRSRSKSPCDPHGCRNGRDTRCLRACWYAQEDRAALAYAGAPCAHRMIALN